jgi:hypothetical protein
MGRHGGVLRTETCPDRAGRHLMSHSAGRADPCLDAIPHLVDTAMSAPEGRAAYFISELPIGKMTRNRPGHVVGACLSLLVRFRGQNRRGINKLTTLALAVEIRPQRVDDIGLSGPPPDLRG